jgi:diketogulonate reductase-like aldo/keto reductase
MHPLPAAKGAVVLPKATATLHIQQNAELGFEISAADMGALDAMRNTERHVGRGGVPLVVEG